MVHVKYWSNSRLIQFCRGQTDLSSCAPSISVILIWKRITSEKENSRSRINTTPFDLVHAAWQPQRRPTWPTTCAACSTSCRLCRPTSRPDCRTTLCRRRPRRRPATTTACPCRRTTAPSAASTSAATSAASTSSSGARRAAGSSTAGTPRRRPSDDRPATTIITGTASADRPGPPPTDSRAPPTGVTELHDARCCSGLWGRSIRALGESMAVAWFPLCSILGSLRFWPFRATECCIEIVYNIAQW